MGLKTSNIKDYWHLLEAMKNKKQTRMRCPSGLRVLKLNSLMEKD